MTTQHFVSSMPKSINTSVCIINCKHTLRELILNFSKLCAKTDVFQKVLNMFSL